MDEKIQEIFDALRTDQKDVVVEAFDELLRLLEHEDDPDVWAQTGYTFQEAGFLPYAKEIYETALGVFSDDDRWQVLLAEVAGDDGDFDGALNTLIMIDPSSPYYLQSLLLSADAYQQLGMSEVSLLKLQEAKEIAPDEPAIILGLAELHRATGHFHEAIPYYRQLLEDDSEIIAQSKSRIEKEYVECLMAVGEYETVIDYLSEIPKADRTQEVNEQLALCFYQTKEYDRAESILSPLYEGGSLSEGLFPIYAEVLYHLHREADASRVMTENVHNHPYKAAAYYQRARVYVMNHQDDAAIEDLYQAYQLESESVDIPILLMRTLLKNDREDDALEILEETKEQLSGDQFEWLAAGIYEANEQFEAAREYYIAAYDSLKTEDSFVSDYLTFMWEDGDRLRVRQTLKDHPELMEQSEWQWLIDALSEEREDDGYFFE